MDVQVPHCLCYAIFNHTLLCEFHQGKLLLHLTIPFEEKPKTNLPSDNLKYYCQRNQMTTRQLAEKLDIVPSTVVMYENGKHPIPYDVADYSDADPFLSLPIRNEKEMIRCYITDYKAVVCLYCRTPFSLSHIEM